MSTEQRIAEVHLMKQGSAGRPSVEVSVPRGITLADLGRLQHLLDHELLPKLSPTGCGPCMSGVDIRIREMLGDVLRVDVQQGRIM